MNTTSIIKKLRKKSFRLKDKPKYPYKVVPLEKVEQIIEEISKDYNKIESRLNRFIKKNDELSSAYYTPTYDEAEIINTIKRKLSKWNRMIQYLEEREDLTEDFKQFGGEIDKLYKKI